MSAETLRKAAALMRKRAKSVQAEGRWYVNERPSTTGIWASHEGPTGRGRAVVYSSPTVGAAEHIASWHPAVALAVADWLDDAAEDLDMQSPGGELRRNWDMRVHIAGDKALAVARAYLGSVDA